MENKYYTPELEEFHVGFEFEFYNKDYGDRDWVNTVFDPEPISGYLWEIEDIQPLINNDEVRVKCLDREGIESLGWIKREDPFEAICEHEFVLNGFILSFLSNRTVVVRSSHQSKMTERLFFNVVFSAELRNKSELKWVMDRCKITQ